MGMMWEDRSVTGTEGRRAELTVVLSIKVRVDGAGR